MIVYKYVVEYSIIDLQDAVNDLATKGWKTFGSLSISSPITIVESGIKFDRRMYVQGMQLNPGNKPTMDER